MEHTELNIKRFALKALAQLCQLPRGPEQVLANAQNLRTIAFMLVKVGLLYPLDINYFLCDKVPFSLYHVTFRSKMSSY